MVLLGVATVVRSRALQRGYWLEPRYNGRPISAWFPHWWIVGSPPPTVNGFNGPKNVGPEAVPFLIHELSLNSLKLHEAYARFSNHLPRRWLSKLPQPYPPSFHKTSIMYWLGWIATTPGGPETIAKLAENQPVAIRRRLYAILIDARCTQPIVLSSLKRTVLNHSDDAVRRVATKAWLHLKPDLTDTLVLEEIVRLMASDPSVEGIEWSNAIRSHLVGLTNGLRSPSASRSTSRGFVPATPHSP